MRVIVDIVAVEGEKSLLVWHGNEDEGFDGITGEVLHTGRGGGGGGRGGRGIEGGGRGRGGGKAGGEKRGGSGVRSEFGVCAGRFAAKDRKKEKS